jgi:UDP-2,4-diacetamido-2,4,6-trideoxy-beta-L-altropyranose hydrolase
MAESRGQIRDDEPAIRTASIADAELLWAWANDAETRSWSFESGPIPWEMHITWLETKLADPATRIYIVGAGATPKASVRFETDGGGVAVVSIVVDPRERGRGWGTRALDLSCRCAVRDLGLQRVDAYIRPGNRASITAFERAGFSHVAESGRPDALRMVWRPGSQ